MRAKVNSVCVIVKTGLERAVTLAEAMGDKARELGVSCRIMENLPGAGVFDFIGNGGTLPDVIFVLGGDGTMLSVARKLNGKPVPLAGINLGRLGFMAELDADAWESSFEDMVRNGFRTSPRMLLRFRVLRRGRLEQEGLVSNDMVINRGGLARLVQLRICIGGESMGGMRADGLIISTPTGSTAYCASAGGPLLHPELDAIALVPICPFMGRFMPLVVGAEVAVSIAVEETSAEVLLTLDGQKGTRLEAGDIINVFRAEERMHLVAFDGGNYLRRLKQKGFFVDWAEFAR